MVAADVRAHVLRAAPQFLFAVVLMLAACLAVRSAVSHEIVRDQQYLLAKATADSLSGHPTPGFGPDGRPSLQRLVNAQRGEWMPNYRPAGWTRLDVSRPPRLDFLNLSVDTARALTSLPGRLRARRAISALPCRTGSVPAFSQHQA